LLYDINGITREPNRGDIQCFKVDAVAEASRMGSVRVFNMIVLGAYLKIRPVLSLEHVVDGLKKSLPKRHHHLLSLNEDAINQGLKAVQPADFGKNVSP
jgi:2-oxoglutarate ferredoxin oxidoreductase subunit gamma